MKVILTGATGMVGKGVLLECLDHPEIKEVLTLGRSRIDLNHRKLKQVEHPDFSEFQSIQDQLVGYDAAYLCMGVSAAGMDEATYMKFTYDYTLSLVRVLFEINPQMTITYVSGRGTDSSEMGKAMWARIKGKTENAILQMGFHQAYAFRPGGIIPMRGIKPSSKLYRRALFWLGWILPILKVISPSSIVNTDQIGRAMINVSKKGYQRRIVDSHDILTLSVTE